MDESMINTFEDQRPAKRLKTSPDNGSMAAKTVESEKEVKFGITEFIDPSRSIIYGTLKKRYTDFMVNEISPDGRTLHLRSTKTKNAKNENENKIEIENSIASAQHEKPESTQTVDGSLVGSLEETSAPEQLTSNGSNELEKNGEQNGTDATVVSAEDKSKLIEYFDEDATDQLLALYENIVQNPETKARDHATVRTMFTSDRSVRAQIHQDIRRIFHSRIDSSTDKEGYLVLTALPQRNRNAGGGGGGGQRGSGPNHGRPGKLGWIDRGGEYVHFNLYKENKDTMEVIGFLTKQLRINAKAFAFAGTKDRRAVTVQRVSAYRIEAERIAGLNRMLRNAAVGDFEYKTGGLELGELFGNEFVITLRDCGMGEMTSDNIEEKTSEMKRIIGSALEDIRNKGYLNYYGLQRFGTFSVATDVVGVLILKGDFEGACNAIMDFNPDALNSNQDTDSKVGADDRARAEAIKSFQTHGRVNEALDKLPRKFSAEAAIIRHLGKNHRDFYGALMAIQRNLRLMYVHAYQSLVWNLAVSERWQLYGDKVAAGDLVLVSEHKQKQQSKHEEVDEAVDADGEIIVQAAADDRAKGADDIFERARTLTADEAASGDYTIFDVVLPQPGFDVLYPANASGKFYETFMASERGGGLDPQDMRRKHKDFSLSGGYRKMIARIGPEYSVDVHRYDDEDQQFVQTDMEKLTAAKVHSTEPSQGKIDNGASKEVKKDATGEKIAVVVKFQLGSSQYATMMCRELSRCGIQAHKADFGSGR